MRPKTLIWEALGLHFGTLGLHFGVFLEALTPLGAHCGHFGGIYRKMEPFCNRIPVHVGSIFGSKCTKVANTVQKVGVQKVVGKKIVIGPHTRWPNVAPIT